MRCSNEDKCFYSEENKLARIISIDSGHPICYYYKKIKTVDKTKQGYMSKILNDAQNDKVCYYYAENKANSTMPGYVSGYKVPLREKKCKKRFICKEYWKILLHEFLNCIVR